MTPAPKLKGGGCLTITIIIIIITTIVVLLSSCAMQGYGCNGKGKIITRVKQF